MRSAHRRDRSRNLRSHGLIQLFEQIDEITSPSRRKTRNFVEIIKDLVSINSTLSERVSDKHNLNLKYQIKKIVLFLPKLIQRFN